MLGALISYHSFLRNGSTAFFLPPYLDLRGLTGACSVCVWFSLGALAAWPRAAGVGAVTVRASGAAAPGGPRVASRGAPALSELPLLPATLCRLAVSAARRRAARFGAQAHLAAVLAVDSRRGDALCQSFILADSHGCCDLPRA